MSAPRRLAVNLTHGRDPVATLRKSTPVSDVMQIEGQRAAAEYLRQLLLKPGRYRDAWQCRVARPRDDVINQMAVAEVIVGQLRSTPGRPGDAQMMPYQLRETVSGALAGLQLSRQTLELFVDAFGFAEHEAERLRRLWIGTARISVLSGSHAVPTQAEHDVDQALGPRKHQTISLHDHVWVSADRRIDRVRTLQVIQSTADGLARIPFVCDTNVLTIEVGHSCRQLADEVRQIGDDMFAAEFILARSLDLGETLTLEYLVSYRYPGDPADPAEREYRRAVIRSVDNLDVRIEFHPDTLPAHVWWAHWDGVEGGVLDQDLVTLDSQHSAHRFLRSLDRTVVGFHWVWH
jgi:hypothetical protein